MLRQLDHAGPGTEKKTFVLVFPPYTLAASPPLGVCNLKSYVERMLPNWSVRVLDLNLEAHEEFIGSLDPVTVTKPAEGDKVEVRHAAEVWKGSFPEEFYDKERYLHLAQVWIPTLREALMPSRDLLLGLRTGAMPSIIRRHARLILKERPSAIGISVCYTAQRLHALCLAKEIKRRSRIPVIVGGTDFSEGVPREWGPVHHAADYAVVGAGEKPLVEILAGRGTDAPVPGVARLGAGELEVAPPIYDVDLDEFGSPDFSDLPLLHYYSPEPVLPVVTSRGCYWHRCAFCSHFRAAGQIWQRRSIQTVVEELEDHVRNGIRNFYLADSVISPARFSQLADAIIASGIRIRYYAMARFERQFDAGLLERMRRSGCLFVLWGLESGSQRVLDRMDKGTLVSDAEKVLKTAHGAGIRNHVFVICGFPTETREEFGETLALLERNRPWLSAVHRTLFALEEDSLVHRYPERFGITKLWPKTTLRLFDFKCSQGMTPREAFAAFRDAKKFMRSFSGLPSIPGDFKFREHCLLSYAWESPEP
jgi:anaerobic magnesium-protoporphyrin IX monomethyl ester cyclase